MKSVALPDGQTIVGPNYAAFLDHATRSRITSLVTDLHTPLGYMPELGVVVMSRGPEPGEITITPIYSFGLN